MKFKNPITMEEELYTQLEEELAESHRIINELSKPKINWSDVMLGIPIGMMVISLATALGEARYSDAIKTCVLELGPNK